MLDDYLSLVGELVRDWGYLAIFLGLALEATVIVGIVVPGLFVLIFAGYYSALGSLDLFGALGCALAGTVIGDWIGYFIGYRGLLSLKSIRRMSERFSYVEATVRESSGWFLFVYHFPAFSRMIVPPLLGMAKFEFRRFLWRDLVGAALFVLTYGTIGYLIGLAARALQDAIDISQVLQGVFLVFLAWWVISIVWKIRSGLRKSSKAN